MKPKVLTKISGWGSLVGSGAGCVYDGIELASMGEGSAEGGSSEQTKAHTASMIGARSKIMAVLKLVFMAMASFLDRLC